MTYQQKHRTNVPPADAPENAWPLAQHLFDVGRKSIDAIEPKYSGGLNEHHKQDCQTGTVNVQEVDEIDTALYWYIWISNRFHFKYAYHV